MNVQIIDPIFDVKLPAIANPATPSPARGSLPLWGLAALAAVALHAGCIAVIIAFLHTEDLDDDLGAPAMEIGLDLAAPRLEPTDLPPGPEAEDAAASPEVAEQKVKAEATDLPKALPTETEDPDRLVTPDASKKPKEDDPELKAVEAMPSTQSTASEATAPPTSETALESPHSTAPTQGTGESMRRVRMTWEKQLASHLDRHKRYPPTESRRNAEIVVSFTLDRMGHILSSGIIRSSGDASFDEAALAMLRRSDPVPAPPPTVADEGLSFTLPVIFRAKGRS